MADYRRPTREIASQAASDSDHALWCWEGTGPGARLRVRVDQAVDSMTAQIDGVARETRKELGTIKKRMWYLNGGVAVVVALTSEPGATAIQWVTSPDGVVWTTHGTPDRTIVTNQWAGLVFARGIFVAVGASGSGNRVMTSGILGLTA